MEDREKKIEALMESLGALRRHMAFHSASPTQAPRITPAQWGALMMIEQCGQSTVKAVAKVLCITSSAATQLVDGLVASGYVAREMHPEDRRVVRLTLSVKTKTQVNKMKQQGLQKFLKFFEVLSDQEFDQYLLLNHKIAERFINK